MNTCSVCNSVAEIKKYTCEVDPYKGKVLHAIQCTGCGFVQFPENNQSYAEQLAENEFEKQAKYSRNANEFRPGREFYMAKMGFEILGTHDPEVTFFGPGFNPDHEWIKREYPRSTTKLVDLSNMQNAENFEFIADASPSDVVVASEVIEHFENPLDDLKRLLGIMKETGVLICSTNIYDGTNINVHQYPFSPGHVAYWTPLSLIRIAANLGYFVDFRTPEIGLKRAGPRKKYIIFYKKIDVLFGISAYFGLHVSAPSEKS